MTRDGGVTKKYNKLLSWRVQNFMGVEDAELTFDASNIIVLKGLNGSCKSASLQALKCLFYYHEPMRQIDFIRDYQDFFVVSAKFEGGYTLKLEKHSDGKSAYSLDREGVCIFSTIENGQYTPLKGVPEPIQNFLGVVEFNGLQLNARDCNQPFLLVDTTGSENYSFLNVVLRSEEVGLAGAALNADKNEAAKKLKKDKILLEHNLRKLLSKEGYGWHLAGGLDELDKIVLALTHQKVVLERVKQLGNERTKVLNTLIKAPLVSLRGESLVLLDKTKEKVQLKGELTEKVKQCKLLGGIYEQEKILLRLLQLIQGRQKGLVGSLAQCNTDEFVLLQGLKEKLELLREDTERQKELVKGINYLNQEIDKLKARAKDSGLVLTMCSYCHKVSSGEGHTHG